VIPVRAIRLAVFTFALALPQQTFAQTPVASLSDGRDGVIFFKSSTPSGFDQYLGAAASAPEVVVSGVLHLPAGSERVPAIVLTHSAGGVAQDRDLAWADRFNKMGLATFVVDSFGPRGVKGFANQPSFVASVADVHAALGLLATHPRIDGKRIALMGFSRGGTAALTSTLAPVHRVAAPAGARFAAHIALYPACNTRYLAAETTRGPIVMLLGGADDQAPPEPCRRYGAWFAAKGVPVTVVEYPGARHLFDGAEDVHLVAQALSPATCDAEYDTDTRTLRRTDTGAALTGSEVSAYFASCTTRGVHVGGDPDARAAAQREIARFLSATLDLPK
jgi:dienelactone hydrolase